jgi:hypothetical protein
MVKIPVADPGREHYEELLKWVRVGATAAGHNPDDYMIGGEAQGLELCITNKTQDLYLTMGEYVPDGPGRPDRRSPTASRRTVFYLHCLITIPGRMYLSNGDPGYPDETDIMELGHVDGLIAAVEQFLTHPLRDQIQTALSDFGMAETYRESKEAE